MEHLGEDEWNTQREEEQHLFHQREVPPPEEDLSHWKRVQDWFCSLLQSINDPAKARDARKYSLLILSVYVPLPVIIALKQLFYEGELYSGRPAEVILMWYFYIPSILFCVYGLARFTTDNREQLGSFYLRLSICILAGFFLLNKLGYILSCFPDKCSLKLLSQHILQLFFLVGLAIYVAFNHCYPKSSIFHLLCHHHLCAAAIYTYAITLAIEEYHIYLEIIKRRFGSVEGEIEGRVAKRIYQIAGNKTEDCNGANILKCMFDDYRDMISVATLESLIVCITIIYANICVIGGKEEERQHQHGDVEGVSGGPPQGTEGSPQGPEGNRLQDSQEAECLKRRKWWFWVLIIVIAIVVLQLVIYLNIWKGEYTFFWIKPNSTKKRIFTYVHSGILFIGSIVCLYFLNRTLNRRETNNRDSEPLEVLDRKLLCFGTIGILTFIWAGIAHSYSLYVYVRYRRLYEYTANVAFYSLIINLFSLVQVLLQTIVIMHRDIANSKNAFFPAIVLWTVNFAMFSLDLFDAATFGYYANPIPWNTNIKWAMLVRGLGPFNVFYRFHSLSLIADSIEDHIKHQHAAPVTRDVENAANVQQIRPNGGENTESRQQRNEAFVED